MKATVARQMPAAAWLAALLAVGAACGDGAVPSSTSSQVEPDRIPPEGPFTIAPEIPANRYFPEFPPDRSFAVAAGDGGFLVAYTDIAGRGWTDVFTIALDDVGSPRSDSPVRVSDASADGYLVGESAEYRDPGVAFDGENFGVAFVGRGSPGHGVPRVAQSLSLVRVAPDGRTATAPQTLDTEWSVTSGYSAIGGPVALAAAPGAFYTAHQLLMGGLLPVPFTTPVHHMVPGDGGPGSRGQPPMSSLLAEHSIPAITATSEGVFIVSFSTSVGSIGSQAVGSLRGSFLVPGRAPSHVTIADTPVTDRIRQEDVRVASSPTDDILIVWSVGEQILGLYYRRDQPMPAITDAFVIEDTSGDTYLGGLTWASGRFLLVWHEDGAAYGTRVGLDRTAGGTFEIDAGPLNPRMAVATLGDRALVLLARPKGVTEESVDLEGVFVSLAE